MGIEPDEDLSVVVRVVERNFDVERETCRACWKNESTFIGNHLKTIKKKNILKLILYDELFSVHSWGMCGGGTLEGNTKLFKLHLLFYLVGLLNIKLTNFTKCRYFDKRKPVQD
jgi:hypothetical protein